MDAKPSSGPDPEQVCPFQFAILVLSVVALTIIAVDAFLTLPSEISLLLQRVDLIICGAFAVDFVVRFYHAPSKAEFLRLGWIDLIASIPNLDWLRWGRSVRVLRVLRILRGIRSLHRLLAMVFRERTKGGIVSVVLSMFLLVVFSSIAILFCETDPESNITTAGDAVWWSVTTITTVGYGDRYPITWEGRVLAMTLMLAGVGLFGALSGIVASIFLGQPEEDSEMLAELRKLRAQLATNPSPPASSLESE